MEHTTSATSGKDKMLQSHVEMFQSNRISTKRSTFTTPNIIIQGFHHVLLELLKQLFSFQFLNFKMLAIALDLFQMLFSYTEISSHPPFLVIDDLCFRSYFWMSLGL